MRQQIITDLYNSRELKDVISKMNPEHLREELLSEVMLVVCNLSEDRLFQMHNDGYLKFYVIRTILNMIKSNDSGFHNKFRKIYEQVPNIVEVKSDYEIMEEKFEKAEEFQENLPFYEKNLLKYYIQYNCKAKKLSNDTGIPVRSIYETISKIKRKAKMSDLFNEKIKFTIECEIDVPKEWDIDQIIDELDKIFKKIQENKQNKFIPICYKIS
jgi:predicted HAD superfamily phosphohydrolase